MIISSRQNVPRYFRDNIESFLLVSDSVNGAKNLSVTLVEMLPGGFQHIHSHESEQMYYILEGTGIMAVDTEEKEVKAGDCVFFPLFQNMA
jgi:mannose-6-phosphate isomerase-like protein (cupin superfamily)